jgi:hypothetical protein
MKKKKQMYPPLWPWFTYDHHMPSACPCFVIGLQCLFLNLHEIKNIIDQHLSCFLLLHGYIGQTHHGSW